MTTDIREFTDRIDVHWSLLVYTSGAGRDGHICLHFRNAEGYGPKFWVQQEDVVALCEAILTADSMAEHGPRCQVVDLYAGRQGDDR